MLPMSSSDTSVPMEISAASLTSASISSGRISDRSELATFVRSPADTNIWQLLRNVTTWKLNQCTQVLEQQYADFKQAQSTVVYSAW